MFFRSASTTILTVVALISSIDVSAAQNLPLPALPYDYDALEPYIDAETMRIHHLKHHQTYTDQLNIALAAMRATPEHKSFAKLGVDVLVTRLSSVPEQYRSVIRNHGGGYINHAFFWKCLRPPQKQPPSSSSPPSTEGSATPIPAPVPQPPNGELSTAIIKTFGSFDQFRTLFTQSATSLFGSGWVWLYVTSADSSGGRRLEIGTTPNQDTVTMQGYSPIIGLDVWEHAYYLKHQNKRKDYVDGWWHIVNWSFAESNYAAAMGLPHSPTHTEL